MWKQYVDAETLDLAEVQALADQGVLPYASAAARDAEITSPQTGMVSLITGQTPARAYYYDGNAWAPLSASTVRHATIGDRDASGAEIGLIAYVDATDGLSYLTPAGWVAIRNDFAEIADYTEITQSGNDVITASSAGRVLRTFDTAFNATTPSGLSLSIPTVTATINATGNVGVHVVHEHFSNRSLFWFDMRRTADNGNPGAISFTLSWHAIARVL